MKYIGSVLLCCISIVAAAQDYTDVLRFSQHHIGGTARYTSMGGAFGALGGDVGAITSNPGAMGVYRRGEWSFTPGLFTGVSSATLNNVSEQAAKPNINFGSLGYVGVYPATKAQKRGSPWKSFTLSIGYNRANQYHSEIATEIVNNNSSLVDQYLSELNGNAILPENIYSEADPFGTILAWNTFLIDTLNSQYVSAIPAGYGQTQRYERTTRGRTGENYFGFGGNLNHKLYVGATLGITRIVYDQTIVHTESIEANPLDSLIQWTAFAITDSLRTRGNGYNLKIGAIYRLTRALRVGAALHTPSVFNMTEEWSASIDTEFEEVGVFEDVATGGYYEYLSLIHI